MTSISPRKRPTTAWTISKDGAVFGESQSITESKESGRFDVPDSFFAVWETSGPILQNAPRGCALARVEICRICDRARRESALFY